MSTFFAHYSSFSGILKHMRKCGRQQCELLLVTYVQFFVAQVPPDDRKVKTNPINKTKLSL